MANKTYIKISGNWKEVVNIWTKISDSWQSNVYSWIRVADLWHKCILYPPPIPVATAATGVTTTNFIANWNVATGAVGYYFTMYDEYSTYMYTMVDLGNVLSEDISNNFTLDPGWTYYYYVQSYNNDGPSGDSNTIEVTTLT